MVRSNQTGVEARGSKSNRSSKKSDLLESKIDKSFKKALISFNESQRPGLSLRKFDETKFAEVKLRHQGKLIVEGDTEPGLPAVDDPIWAEMSRFAQSNTHADFAKFARRLLVDSMLRKVHREKSSVLPTGVITEIPPLPKKAPERWPSDPNKRTENPAEFATRVYRVWMDSSVLTRQALKSLDPLLFSSLNSWLKYNRSKESPEPFPEGFNLLTAGQANDVWIARIQSGQQPSPSDPAGLARYAMALKYRERDERKK
ncbi:MAG: hypothetical protein JO261_11170 [Alphaproteobacteria bacterium]|nr:hypothetical protein [Alphaproteobacteria bacterium]